MPGLVWGLRRALKGKRFGNEIADSMTVSRGLFHSAMEEGGLATHMMLFAAFKDDGKSVTEARDFVLPFLEIGLYAIQERFGEQNKITHALNMVDEFRVKER